MMVSKRNLLFQGLLFGFHKFLGHMEECYWVLPFRKKTSSNVRLNCQLFSGCTCHAQQSIQTCVFLCKKKPFGVFILKYILATFYVWGFPKWHFYFDLLASISGVALLTSKTLNTVTHQTQIGTSLRRVVLSFNH